MKSSKATMIKWLDIKVINFVFKYTRKIRSTLYIFYQINSVWNNIYQINLTKWLSKCSLLISPFILKNEHAYTLAWVFHSASNIPENQNLKLFFDNWFTSINLRSGPRQIQSGAIDWRTGLYSGARTFKNEPTK